MCLACTRPWGHIHSAHMYTCIWIPTIQVHTATQAEKEQQFGLSYSVFDSAPVCHVNKRFGASAGWQLRQHNTLAKWTLERGGHGSVLALPCSMLLGMMRIVFKCSMERPTGPPHWVAGDTVLSVKSGFAFYILVTSFI